MPIHRSLRINLDRSFGSNGIAFPSMSVSPVPSIADHDCWFVDAHQKEAALDRQKDCCDAI
jgi:hypothetical protein